MDGLILLGLAVVAVFLVAFFREFIPSVRQIRYELRQRRTENEHSGPSDGPVG